MVTLFISGLPSYREAGPSYLYLFIGYLASFLQGYPRRSRRCPAADMEYRLLILRNPAFRDGPDPAFAFSARNCIPAPDTRRLLSRYKLCIFANNNPTSLILCLLRPSYWSHFSPTFDIRCICSGVDYQACMMTPNRDCRLSPPFPIHKMPRPFDNCPRYTIFT